MIDSKMGSGGGSGGSSSSSSEVTRDMGRGRGNSSNSNSEEQLYSHWASVGRPHLNPRESIFQYKAHAGRLLAAYQGAARGIDNRTPAGFVDRRIEVETDREQEVLREESWNSRVVQGPRDDPRARKTHSSEASLSAHTRPTQHLRDASPSTAHARGPRDHRCEGAAAAALPPEEVVARGMYVLSEDKLRTYRNFVAMLTAFDEHDMLKILEDAFMEAHARCSLDDYGGTEPSISHDK